MCALAPLSLFPHLMLTKMRQVMSLLQKPPRKNGRFTKQLTFTLFMTGGMVTLMSLYNTALHTWFNFTLFDWLSGMLLRLPIAFVTSLTIGDVIAKRALMPLVRRIASPSGWIASHIIPFCKVNAMVPFMTFFASLLSVGISQDLGDSLDPYQMTAAGTREVLFNVYEAW